MSSNKELVEKLERIRATLANSASATTDQLNTIDEVISALQEPVRVYNYVWTEDEEEGTYASNYSPANPVRAGAMFAVVHPSQLPFSYVHRTGSEPDPVNELISGPLCEAAFTRKGWGR